MPLRFVHVNHRYAPYIGGSERFVQEISERFAGVGHDVRVVTSNAYDLEYFWDARRQTVDAPTNESWNGVGVSRVPVAHGPASSIVFRGIRRLMGEASRIGLPAGPFRAASTHQPWMPGLANAISREPSDLIHATNLGIEGLAIVASQVARRADIPFVLTPFIHLGVQHDHIARRYVTMPHQIELLRSADAILTMTDHEATFVSSHGISPERVHVVGAGVSPHEVTNGGGHRFRTRHNLHGIVVGSIGALAPDKGTLDLVRTVQKLRRNGHDIGLVLAGSEMSTFTRWYAALDERAREGIQVVGVVDAEEKRDLLAAIDLFALPSRTESFGIVYLEAWANRVPVIAADAGAVSELVRNEENGLLVSFGDTESLAAAVLRLAGDAELRTRLGSAGWKLVHSRYTWSLVFDRVQDVYGALLGGPDRR